MTTVDTYTQSKTPQAPGRFRLPDPPEKHPDDRTSFDHLAATGTAHYLAVHLGNPETTLVAGGAVHGRPANPEHGRQLLPGHAGGL